MACIILPTRELVLECQSLDPFFNFIPGNTRSLIQESVLANSYRERILSSRVPFDQDKSPLLQFVLGYYHDYIGEPDSADRSGFCMEEYLDTIGKIEFVTGVIEQATEDILRRYFGRSCVDIARNMRWLEYDLIIHATLPRNHP